MILEKRRKCSKIKLINNIIKRLIWGVKPVTLSHKDLRIDLACSLRWADKLGLNEGVSNHFSVAVPNEKGTVLGNRFLVNPCGWHWSEITASSLVLCDENGNVLEGNNEVERSAFIIHSQIHLAAPHAKVIMHTHMPYATSLSMLENTRLEMCGQSALMFDQRIAYDDTYLGLAFDQAEGSRMASKLGNHSIMFMANHGVTVTGQNTAEAFTDLYYLERASMFQVIANSTGKTLRTIPKEIQKNTREQFSEDRPKMAVRYFSALKRMLDEMDPGYRS